MTTWFCSQRQIKFMVYWWDILMTQFCSYQKAKLASGKSINLTSTYIIWLIWPLLWQLFPYVFSLSACCLESKDRWQAAISEKGMLILWELSLMHDKRAWTVKSPRQSWSCLMQSFRIDRSSETNEPGLFTERSFTNGCIMKCIIYLFWDTAGPYEINMKRERKQQRLRVETEMEREGEKGGGCVIVQERK